MVGWRRSVGRASPERQSICSSSSPNRCPTRDRQRIDWYGGGGKTYMPLASLPADEQTAVLARVDELLAAMGPGQSACAAGDAAADALLAAATIPPRQNYIYIAREIQQARTGIP